MFNAWITSDVCCSEPCTLKLLTCTGIFVSILTPPKNLVNILFKPSELVFRSIDLGCPSDKVIYLAPEFTKRLVWLTALYILVNPALVPPIAPILGIADILCFERIAAAMWTTTWNAPADRKDLNKLIYAVLFLKNL